MTTPNYRQLPQIKVVSWKEMIASFKDLDSSAATYPLDSLAGLADLSGIDPGDQIRDEICLPPLKALGAEMCSA